MTYSPAGVTQLTLTAAGNASGGNTVYTCSSTCTGLGGVVLGIAGFVTNPTNNGSFTVQSSTSGNMTVNNAAGVAETHAGTATGLTAQGQSQDEDHDVIAGINWPF